MKNNMFPAVMKTIGSNLDEKGRSLVDSALNIVNEKACRDATVTMNHAMGSFSQAKAVHTENMLRLNDINAAITRSTQERQKALNESAEAEQSWRTRFRELRGMVTAEMKAEHVQRTASRELAEEFTGLIAELEIDKSRAMLAACKSGKAYVNMHLNALSICARNEWAAVMKDISPALVRAFALRLRELEAKGEEQPQNILYQELGEHILAQSRYYTFNMEQEPVISLLGLHRPALTGVDMELYKSPARQMALSKELARKSEAQGIKL